MAVPLLQTKLYAPPARLDLIRRPQLVAKFRAGWTRPLTLIAAPAGFGKTTLVNEWLADLRNDASGESSPVNRPAQTPNIDIAWLSLDAEDNHPTLFLTYLIAAIQACQPQFGKTAFALLTAPHPPAPKTILTLLLNELDARTTPMIVVLDDYHLVTAQPLHEALTFLIDHLPPAIHLVITSRIDPPLPLARWRMRNQLTEIRAEDLRFTPDEATTFLNERMGLNLTSAEITTLETRTEGWIAGLQLAALAMQGTLSGPGHPNRADFIEQFTGSHRYIIDYLVEEVLQHQPVQIQHFLEQTAILEQLSAPLCDAVTERADSQTILEQLQRTNLFLIALDHKRRWYRYHHLFAEVLRSRLRHHQPTAASLLHQRASDWYAHMGMLHDAIHHALAAGDFWRAANLLEQITPDLVFRGQLQTVLQWLKALPAELLRSRPKLCLYAAALYLFTNQFELAERSLDEGEQTIDPMTAPDQARLIQGWAAAMRADLARIAGDLATAITFAQVAVARLPLVETEPLRLRAVAMLDLARAWLVTGDVTAPSEALAASVFAPIAATGNLFATLNSHTNLARLQISQGRLRQAALTLAAAPQALPDPAMLRFMFGGAAYYFVLGDLHYAWNDLAQAATYVNLGMTLMAESLAVDADIVALGFMAQARLQEAQGDRPGADATLEALAQLAYTRKFASVIRQRHAAAQAQHWLAQGNCVAAQHWAEHCGLSLEDELDFLHEAAYLTLARVQLAQGQGNMRSPQLPALLHALDRWLQVAEIHARWGSVIELLLLRAQVCQAQQDQAGALATLDRALTLAAPEGYIRLFVDAGEDMRRQLAEWGTRHPNSHLQAYVSKLQMAFGLLPLNPITQAPAAASHVSPLGYTTFVESLSVREMEVLRLVHAGLSNSEIAKRLIVTVGTVKKHINNIFGKLGVNSRTQALVRARELNLL
ncbi:MAG: LuxR C-terminal-related transcriptional regulator [Chloroflexi bacterium]|nr:LuxR C-terminal-related transcriptional regulator [Chloroflexota bacterium]